MPVYVARTRLQPNCGIRLANHSSKQLTENTNTDRGKASCLNKEPGKPLLY